MAARNLKNPHAIRFYTDEQEGLCVFNLAPRGTETVTRFLENEVKLGRAINGVWRGNHPARRFVLIVTDRAALETAAKDAGIRIAT